MGNNVLEPLVNAIVNAIPVIIKLPVKITGVVCEGVGSIFNSIGSISTSKIFGVTVYPNLEKMFKEINFTNANGQYPIQKGIIDNDMVLNNVLYSIVLKVPSGLTLEDFEGIREQIKMQVSSNIEFIMEGNGIMKVNVLEVRGNDVIISIDKNIDINNLVKYKFCPLEDTECLNVASIGERIRFEYIEGDKNKLEVCIGVDINGQKVWLDMLKSHLLIGGMARYGKSSLLSTIITSFMLNYTENEVKFLYCDFKRADLKRFDKYKHCIGTCSTNFVEFNKQLEWCYREEARRIKILEESKSLNIISHNKKSEDKLSYVLFMVDELPQVTINKDCMEKLHLTMSKLAYIGIYFILATQDCSKNVIGRCKMNASQTIGFRTRDNTDSDLLMPGGNLQDIRIKGRAKIEDGGEILEMQTFFIEEDEVEEYLKHLLKDNISK